MITDEAILNAVNKAAPLLDPPSPKFCLNMNERRSVLAALTFCESTWGLQQYVPRVEPAYMPKGRYFNDAQRKLYARYGWAAASSWGAWHLMYPTAYEYGFREAPWDLTDPLVGAHNVVTFLNRRAFRSWRSAPRPELVPAASTLSQIADCYNSGSHLDSNVPEGYIEKFLTGYNEALSYYGKEST